MRRVSPSFSLIALLVLGLLAAFTDSGPTRAQEGTPTDDELAVPEGVSLEFLASSELPADMEPPAGIEIIRFVVEPEAGFPIAEDDPTTGLVYVESGNLTVTMQGPISVTRAPGEGTPFPMDVEEIAAGTEFMMGAGDSALFGANTAGEIRNDGAETAVAIVALLSPASVFEGGAATPEG